MTWIQTYSGQRFTPLEPDLAAVRLEDIAHSLALQCRFNGHCRIFYSVAEHSVRVARLLPRSLAAWGLLHDAAEAYLGDVPRPLKAQTPFYAEAEERLLRLIVEHFGLPWPMPDAVARADEQLLATEARDLMAPPPEPWPLAAAPLDEPIVPVGPVAAEALFLEEARQLTLRG